MDHLPALEGCDKMMTNVNTVVFGKFGSRTTSTCNTTFFLVFINLHQTDLIMQKHFFPKDLYVCPPPERLLFQGLNYDF